MYLSHSINECFPYGMGNGASKKLGVDVPHNTQGEPYPIVRMGPYWMGHSSVKVTSLLPLSIA